MASICVKKNQKNKQKNPTKEQPPETENSTAKSFFICQIHIVRKIARPGPREYACSYKEIFVP